MKKTVLLLILIISLTGCTSPTEKTYYEIPKSEVVEPTNKPLKSTTTEPQPSSIPSTSDKEKQKVQYTNYKNARYGFSVDIPDFLSPERPPDNGDGNSFVSVDGNTVFTVYGSHSPTVFYEIPNLEQLYLDELNKLDYVPNYKTKGENWFVISWEEDSVVKYEKYLLKSDGTENVLIMSYQKSEEKKFDDVVTHVSKSFKTGYGDDSDTEN